MGYQIRCKPSILHVGGSSTLYVQSTLYKGWLNTAECGRDSVVRGTSDYGDTLTRVRSI